MSGNKKAPPKFYTPYAEWKEELSMWELLKCYEAKEQGLIVRLHSLQDNVQAKRAVSTITAAQLNEANGLQTLITALDIAFQADRNDLEYSNYKRFNSYKRKPKQENQDLFKAKDCHPESIITISSV